MIDTGAHDTHPGRASASADGERAAITGATAAGRAVADAAGAAAERVAAGGGLAVRVGVRALLAPAATDRSGRAGGDLDHLKDEGSIWRPVARAETVDFLRRV